MTHTTASSPTTLLLLQLAARFKLKGVLHRSLSFVYRTLAVGHGGGYEKCVACPFADVVGTGCYRSGSKVKVLYQKFIETSQTTSAA